LPTATQHSNGPISLYASNRGGVENAKSQVLKAAWLAGAPVRGLRLPLVSRCLPSRHKFIGRLMGWPRRSVAAPFFIWDLDIAVYSSNWGRPRHPLPSRTCAHCFWQYPMSGVEDESHILFVCRLYSALCRALPFTGTQVWVEGDAMPGDGCTMCNLTSLVRHVLALPSIDVVGAIRVAIPVRSSTSLESHVPLRVVILFGCGPTARCPSYSYGLQPQGAANYSPTAMTRSVSPSPSPSPTPFCATFKHFNKTCCF
jgi:hypothetical protein